MTPHPRYNGAPDRRARARELFVDRDGPRSVFINAVSAIGEGPCQVLTFYGVGGQGKTQLCNELARRLADETIGSHLRWGLVDLRDKEERQSSYLLLWIRNALVKDSKVHFPAFDFAFEIFWRETHGSQPTPLIIQPWWEEIQENTVNVIAEGAPLLLDHIPFLGPLLGRMGRHAIKYARKEILRRANAALSHLYLDKKLLPADEIERRLPFILAQDLEGWRKDNPDDRFVLLIDEYEKALESGGASNLLRNRDIDEAMRDLVAQCGATLFVFFSREKLRWDLIDLEWTTVFDNRQHLLGGLAHDDADHFLQLAGVTDAALRTAMILGASANDPVAEKLTTYPIMLDLQVAYWESLIKANKVPVPDQFRIDDKDFDGKRRELLGRLVRSYGRELQATLARLAVARRFDEDLFIYVIKTFHTGVQLDDWNILKGLSFVEPLVDGNNFTFHALVREGLMASLDDAARMATHQAFFDYFERASLVQNMSCVPFAPTAVVGDTRSYASWYRYEHPQWKEWQLSRLYHLAASRPDGDWAVGQAILRIYFDAFWWWGYYQPFAFCDSLIDNWEHRNRSAKTKGIFATLRQFTENYPDGYEKKGMPGWPEVKQALLLLRHDAKLDGAVADLGAEQQHIRGFIDFFLAEAYAYGVDNDVALAIQTYQSACSTFASLGDHWIQSWILFYMADFLRDVGDSASERAANIDQARACCVASIKLAENVDVHQRDPEVLANVYRLLGDIDCVRQGYDHAAENYFYATAYAYAFQGIPVPPDPYTIEFYREIIGKVSDRIAALLAEGFVPAGRDLLSAIDARWAPYRGDNSARAVDVTSFKADDIATYLFPPPPSEEDDDHEKVMYQAKVRSLVDAGMFVNSR